MRGEAAAGLQIHFHNMQFHTQFAVTKRPRTHQTLARLTAHWPEGLAGVALRPERGLGLSGASPTAAERRWSQKPAPAFFKCHCVAPFLAKHHSLQPDLPGVNLSCQDRFCRTSTHTHTHTATVPCHSVVKFQWITFQILHGERRKRRCSKRTEERTNSEKSSESGPVRKAASGHFITSGWQPHNKGQTTTGHSGLLQGHGSS